MYESCFTFDPCYDVRTHVYVVTPYCGGGDLLKMVVPGEGTGEKQARKWFRQILLGLAYVHGKVKQGRQGQWAVCCGMFHH